MGDADGVRHLFLGVLHPIAQAKAQFHDLAFSGRQSGHRTPQRGALGAAFQRLAHFRLVVRQHIHQQKLVAVGINVQRFVNAGILPTVAAFAQIHQNFILNAAAGVGGQLDVLARLEGVDRFDEADGADGNQVLHPGRGGVELFGNVHDKTQIMGDEQVSGGGVPLGQTGERLLFLFRRQRGRQRVGAVDVIQSLPGGELDEPFKKIPVCHGSLL